MKITFYGHSCFLIETGSHRLIIDPFLNDNPDSPVKAKDVKVDHILVTHGHEDHTCDVLEVAKANGATVVANFEIAEYFGAQGAKFVDLNPGGGANFPFGRVKLTLAHHSSSMKAGLNPIYLGSPCGILLEAEGKRIYHAGDTALFLDMQLIGRGGLDLAILPIGDKYTMGPDDALDALDLLKPKRALPMHFNTWPPIAQDAAAFARRAAERGHAVEVLKPGSSLTL